MSSQGQTYVRSTKHSLSLANTEKKERLNDLLTEYRRVGQIILDYLWTNGCVYKVGTGFKEFNIDKELYEWPSMLGKEVTDRFPIKGTWLTGRMLKCLTSQICGIIGASVAK